MAVEKMDAVQSVETDMNKHTVTVTFDGEKTSVDEIVAVLNKAGYTVPSYTQTE